MSGLYPLKPYMVNVCGAMGMATEGKTIVVSFKFFNNNNKILIQHRAQKLTSK